ncbi:hypothetical protein [Novosphingobium gossypii]|uniref:hypothetical protein n=1 Tax=Novosphingobium gossypii TaxID=1604774 RepID=UPI003D1FFEE7
MNDMMVSFARTWPGDAEYTINDGDVAAKPFSQGGGERMQKGRRRFPDDAPFGLL